jgi:hypothetical protein
LTRHRRVATAPLDSVNVLAYECASGNQWKQQEFILFFSAF